MLRPRFASFAGGREDGERPHQPEGGRAGRLRGPVQNQETHPAEQADEGVLREAGARAAGATPGVPGVQGAMVPAGPVCVGSGGMCSAPCLQVVPLALATTACPLSSSGGGGPCRGVSA